MIQDDELNHVNRICGRSQIRFKAGSTSILTLIATQESWLCLALVQGLCSRRIVGWAMAAHCTSAFVTQVLRKALAQRQVPQLHHSDRGSQYTSQVYQRQLLVAQSITVLMSRSVDPYDNAVMKSWIGTLKTECIDQVYSFWQVAPIGSFILD